MRIGLLGPADGNLALLREATEFLLRDCGVDQAVYLGPDDDAVDQVVERWAQQVMGQSAAGENAFLNEAVKLALEGDAERIRALLSRDEEVRRLTALRCLPPPPTRAVEVFDDKVVLFVHEKSLLDQEDIANAFLVVYGRSRACALNRFGPRTFFTPGPLKAGRIALLEPAADGSLALVQYDPQTGEPVGRDVLQTRHARLVIQP
jgi:hypothetical protein